MISASITENMGSDGLNTAEEPSRVKMYAKYMKFRLWSVEKSLRGSP